MQNFVRTLQSRRDAFWSRLQAASRRQQEVAASNKAALQTRRDGFLGILQAARDRAEDTRQSNKNVVAGIRNALVGGMRAVRERERIQTQASRNFIRNMVGQVTSAGRRIDAGSLVDRLNPFPFWRRVVEDLTARSGARRIDDNVLEDIGESEARPGYDDQEQSTPYQTV